MSEKLFGYDYLKPTSLRRSPWGDTTDHYFQFLSEKIILNRQLPDSLQIHDEEHQFIIDIAKQHLIDLHATVGITISPSNFPPIYLLPESSRPHFTDKPGLVGGFDFKLLAIRIYVTQPAQYIFPLIVYHELFHSLGRVGLGVALDQEELIYRHHLGFATQARQSRGNALEEGLASLVALNFQKHFPHHLLSPYQEKTIKATLHRLKRQTSRFFFADIPTDDYLASIKLINTLLKDAKRFAGPNLQTELLYLLLRIHSQPEQTRHLGELMKPLYHDGWQLFGDLYKLKTNQEEIQRFIKRLKSSRKF